MVVDDFAGDAAGGNGAGRDAVDCVWVCGKREDGIGEVCRAEAGFGFAAILRCQTSIGIEVGRHIYAMDASTRMILFTLSDPWGLEAPARKAGIMHVISKSEPWKLLDRIKEIVRRDRGQWRRFTAWERFSTRSFGSLDLLRGYTS